MSLKLISLNIEEDKHFHRFLPYFESAQPDVMCLQEVFEKDFRMIRKKCKAHGVFTPMTHKHRQQHPTAPKENVGIAILSKSPIINSSIFYYYGSKDDIPEYI